MSSAKGSSRYVPLVYKLAQLVLFITCKTCFRLKVYGAKNVPDDGRAVIFASNHASYLDPPLFGITVRKHITFLAKDYLYKPFFFGSIMHWLGTLPIKSDSDSKDFRTVRDLLRVLGGGGRIVVFPEGTRTADGNIQKAEGGIGFLAMKSKAWIMPAYIEGAFEAFPRTEKFFKCRPVRMFYGKPFIPAEDPEFKGRETDYLAVAERIMAEIRKIKRDVDNKVYPESRG